MSKKSKKNEKNYLDFIPVKNPDIEYETDENGIVTVFIEWKGFYYISFPKKWNLNFRKWKNHYPV